MRTVTILLMLTVSVIGMAVGAYVHARQHEVVGLGLLIASAAAFPPHLAVTGLSIAPVLVPPALPAVRAVVPGGLAEAVRRAIGRLMANETDLRTLSAPHSARDPVPRHPR